jgi:NADH-quinone oxidoreductase subunit J
MSAAGVAQIVAFATSAFVAVAGALGMATTMSMFRSAIFLMASFMGVAGLFILLSADLLGLLQVMMYIGGMLVMVLFMVLFMPDPGGAMMATMPDMMTPIERFFSLGLARKESPGGSPDKHAGSAEQGDDHESGAHDGHRMDHMDISDMSMVTPVRGWAAWLALATGIALVSLLLLRSSWPTSPAVPDPRSALQVGSLLMDKYMIGFEGAGFLILIGIVGAVLAAHAGQHPDRSDRGARVAVDAPPPPIEPDALALPSESFDSAEGSRACSGQSAGARTST